MLSLSVFGQATTASYHQFTSVEWNFGQNFNWGWEPKFGYSVNLGLQKQLNTHFNAVIGSGLEIMDPLQIPVFMQLGYHLERLNLELFSRQGMSVPLSNYENSNSVDELGWYNLSGINFPIKKSLNLQLGFRYQVVKSEEWFWDGTIDVFYIYRRLNVGLNWSI